MGKNVRLRVSAPSAQVSGRGAPRQSEIVQFTMGANVHPEGYTIDQVWDWDDLKIADDHSFTQWLFPSNKASESRNNSPILSRNDILQFRTDPELRARLLKSFLMMLRFFGFEIRTAGNAIHVDKAADFDVRLRKPFDRGMTWFRGHHFKRITRILYSLTLLGLQQPAEAFFEALRLLYEANREEIPHSTYLYWKEAVGK